MEEEAKKQGAPFLAKFSAASQIITLVLVSISLYSLTPHLNYWKDRCASVQQELSAKASNFQAYVSFFDKKVEVLEKENAALSKNNLELVEKLGGVESLVSAKGDERLHNELAGVKQSLETLSSKLLNQTEKISEVKTDLTTAKTYFSSGAKKKEAGFAADILFVDGTRLNGVRITEYCPAPYGTGSGWNLTSIGYCNNLDQAVDKGTDQSRELQFAGIRRIDVVTLTPAEEEQVKKLDTYNRPKVIKCDVVFHDGNTLKDIFLVPHSLGYRNSNQSGKIRRDAVKAVIFYGSK